ncbi:hypothetical protein [Halomonas sp. 15WGF]|uniref:pyocin knob domain-containing protein n=1 Tax=Halomonas sp. 15WGF TaxID=2570357 RepID=UPI0010BF0717|nr:hypothetical protein [Halomonas sp. 15WGF]TKJ09586.1 hypothetical protein E8Q34_15995 [Halomonas sp. 15WGF]
MSINVNVTAPVRTIAVAQHIGTVTISTANIRVPSSLVATVAVGMRGLPGHGVPKGGAARAVMMKVNGDDYATDWAYVTWEDLLNKPATATRWPTFAEVTDKPDAYPAEAHDHDGRYYTQQQLDTLLSSKLNATAKAVDADKLDGKQLATLEGEYQAAADQAEQNAKEHADTVTAPKLNASAYTAGDVLAKLLTVAGHGSGLDADTLDGKQLATIEAEYRAFTTAAVAALVGSSPETLDTLNELAAALGNDPDFATTVSQQIGTKLNASAYTAADVLAKLLTVHGEGSGLNADKLDGLHAAAFALAVHGHTWAEISGKPATATRWPTFSEVTGKPSAYPAEAHDHDGRYYTQQQLDTLLSGKLNAAAYTAADLLTKLLTIDGAGSGLDADKLDGKQLATIEADYRAFTNAAVAALVDASPATLDTLNELAAALGNDPNFATTVSQQIGTKLNASAYTAADVLAKLLSVDGTGSNLDADLLDGHHASHFATAAQLAAKETLKIVDVRDISDNVSSFDPNASELEERALSLFFGMGYPGNSWRSALTLKGWSGGYVAWQLIGPAGTSPDNDYYLRSGVSDAWAEAVKIWHTGNFNPASKLDAGAKATDSDRLDGRHASQFQWAKVTDDAGRGRHPGVDWNAPTTSGFYDGSNLDHATPFKTHTWQYVIQASHRNGDSYQFQLAADFDSGGNLSARVKKAGNWDTWHKIWTDKDFDPNQFATKIESVTIPTLSWPGNKIYVGQSVEIRITNYDSDTPYSVTATAGSISRSGDRILFVAPSSEQTVTLTVGNRAINIPIETGVVTPRITVPASGDARVATSLTVATTAFEAYA